MKQLALLAAASCMALLLSACGEQEKKVEIKTNGTTVEQQTKDSDGTKTTTTTTVAPKDSTVPASDTDAPAQ
jgi:major membrane immunogen (membrane-anchored lipoprotein)